MIFRHFLRFVFQFWLDSAPKTSLAWLGNGSKSNLDLVLDLVWHNVGRLDKPGHNGLDVPRSNWRGGFRSWASCANVLSLIRFKWWIIQPQTELANHALPHQHATSPHQLDSHITLPHHQVTKYTCHISNALTHHLSHQHPHHKPCKHVVPFTMLTCHIITTLHLSVPHQ